MIVILIIINVYQLSAQSSCTPSLLTQADIDAFPTNYPGCTEITNSVVISSSSDITNLDGLSTVEKIGDNLILFSPNLTSISGLQQLTEVGVNMSVNTGAAILDHSPLKNVEVIGGRLTINSGTNNSYDFSGLRSVAGDFSINNFDGTVDFTTFLALDFIGGFTSISSSSNISGSTFPDFPVLTHIGDQLQISGSFDDLDISGFNALTYLGSTLTIRNMPNVQDISGFGSLEIILDVGSFTNSKGLKIENLDALVDISGFNDLNNTELDIGSLPVLGNLSGFSSLSDSPRIFLDDLPSLTDLNILSNLINVDNLTIQNLDQLSSLSGLASNVTIHECRIQLNDNLSSIEALGFADLSTTSLMNIYLNPLLNDCDVQSICNNLSNFSIVSIHSNAPGCNSTTEIANRCMESELPPENDLCVNAIALNLSVDGTCNQILSSTTNSARNHSPTDCIHETGEEVYFSFTTQDFAGYTIALSGQSKNLVIEVYKGDCNSETFLACGLNNLNVILEGNEPYLIKIYNEVFSEFTDFDICIHPVDQGTLPDEKVGVATISPLNNLHVNGGITLGNSLTEVPGSIRFDGFRFQGNTGLGWVDLSPSNAEYQANDPSPTNEIQLLSKSGSTISLSSGGGSVQDAVDDADNDPSNEIQTLSQSGSTITLSNGGGSVSAQGGAFENVSGTIKSTGGNDDDFVVGSASLPSNNATTEDLFFFDESRASFRVGRLKNSTSWSESNIGFYSFAAGESTSANAIHSSAFGRYNVGGGQSDQWVEDDPLFEIGNGTGEGIDASNAFTVLKKGFTGVKTHAPVSDLHVRHGTRVAFNGLTLENDSTNLSFRLFTNASGNFKLIGVDPLVPVGTIDKVSGVYTANSDARLKEELENLPFDWEKFMKLMPLIYEFKNDKSDRKYIGMLAQEVKKIYPEMVTYDRESDTYQMDYSSFGVIAIKAIQEQQKKIEGLERKIEIDLIHIDRRIKELESLGENK